MATRNPPLTRAQKALLTLILIGFVGLSWSGTMERLADQSIAPTFERALLTAAIARGLNGVISVAQGTEIAVAPVGVGITITAGEILDPLNDLIERFSWLALAASASLGAQLLLSEIFAEPVMNMVLTGTVTAYLLVLWWPNPLPRLGWLLRATALLIFARFLFSVVTLSVGLIDHWVLEERQQAAMSELQLTSAEIEAMDTAPANPPDSETSMLQRFEDALDGTRQALDIEARLAELNAGVEASITHVIDLIVLFFVQTLLLPILAIYTALASFRWFWRWSLSSTDSGNPQRPDR